MGFSLGVSRFASFYSRYTKFMNLTPQLAALVPELQGLKEPQTLQELVEQLGTLGKAMERCEKMLQSLALGKSGKDEASAYVTLYKELVAQEKKLLERRQELVLVEQRAQKSTSWWPWTRRR